MAIYVWSGLVNGELVAFDPATDVLEFDDAAITANSLELGALDGPTFYLSFGGKAVAVLAAPSSLSAESLVFLDGSRLLMGGNGDDSIVGGEGTDRLEGSSGNDSLLGDAGDDRVLGGSGDDTLDGGAGVDYLWGMDGDDTVLFDPADTVVGGGVGSDTLIFTGAATLNLTVSGAPAYFETLVLGGTGTTIELSSSSISEKTDGHRLRIEGGPEDRVIAGAGWRLSGTIVDGETYVRYTQGSSVLEVDSDVARDIGFAMSVADLDGRNGFRLASPSVQQVASAGDINGDGFADVVVGVSNYLNTTNAYVVFGKPQSYKATLEPYYDLTGPGGFTVGSDDHGTGRSVDGIGDLDGDGYGDIAIAGSGAGIDYVLFGKSESTSATVNLSSLDEMKALHLVWSGSGFLSGGHRLAGVGDMNGDGVADLVIGTPLADFNGTDSGAAFVVFGNAAGFGDELDLSALDGTNGVRLSGAGTIELGMSVSRAGDVNGDGLADVLLGNLAYANAHGVFGYVVFGATHFTADMAVDKVDGRNGFAVKAPVTALFSGPGSLRAAGDLNGDGFDDIVLSARDVEDNGTASGAIYVLFGKAGGFQATVDLSQLDGTNGFQLVGAPSHAWATDSVASAGDVNGDGYGDLLIGGPYANPGGTLSGIAYVVYGKPDGFGPVINLATLAPATGFTILGRDTYDYLGTSVSAAGDVNGDGFDDMVISGPDTDSTYGATYVVFGWDFDGRIGFEGGPEADELWGTATPDRMVAGLGDDTLDGGGGADTLLGGGGDDTYFVDSSGDSLLEARDAGFDTAYVSAQNYALGATAAIERIVLVPGALTFTGNLRANDVHGNLAKNVLDGGAGDDTLDGAGGADTLIGGGGNDTYVFGVGDVVIDSGGSDSVLSTVSQFALSAGLENLSLAMMAGAALVTGSAAANHIVGNSYSNTLSGGDGNEKLEGGRGDDFLFGGNGADRLDGGFGADAMDGGAGNDVYVVSSTRDQIVELAGGGVDRVEVQAVRYAMDANVEVAEIKRDAGSILTGNALDNAIISGQGADTLSGGAGHDEFHFRGTLALDHLLDFEQGMDRIILEGSDFSGAVLGGSLLYDASTGMLAMNGAEFLQLGAGFDHPTLNGSDIVIV